MKDVWRNPHILQDAKLPNWNYVKYIGIIRLTLSNFYLSMWPKKLHLFNFAGNMIRENNNKKLLNASKS